MNNFTSISKHSDVADYQAKREYVWIEEIEILYTYKNQS